MALLACVAWSVEGLWAGPRVSVSKTRVRASTLSRQELTEQMRNVRESLAKDEQAQLLMAGLRGQNINDDDSAVAGLKLKLVEFQAGEEKLPLQYDPAFLDAYFTARPSAVAERVWQLTSSFGGFGLSVLSDVLGKRVKENEVMRAAELREIIASLGPFFIKLGQALSIRPDILSPKAMVELQRLCDKVPSFDSAVAMALVEQEYGRRVDEVFSELTPEPVAAASLGQVYKGTLRSNGDVVALKVQRPFVLETVSLDLYLIRGFGLFLNQFPFFKERTDIVGILDEFAYRFYEELDYNLECQNGVTLREDMRNIPDIIIPRNYPELTTRRVFVTEWVDGEKLSQSTAGDVQKLVNLGVVAYLTQLLDTGLFHADPHPGNLIRTPEGKLALIDFGLMTRITDDQKYGIIEAVSHLVHRDYSAIGEDFVKLEFIPRGVDITPIVPALTKVFDAALAGGGAKSINFQELAADLGTRRLSSLSCFSHSLFSIAQITFEYPFRIPPYFALIIRAIGVLEGIALVGNKDFAIVDEAYPYLSRRLLTDESPRLKAALRYMCFGSTGTFDVDRMIDLFQAFENFNSLGFVSYADSDASKYATPDRGAQTTAALKFFFSADGAVVRELLLEEVVVGVDALSRDVLYQLANTLNIKLPRLVAAAAPKLTAEEQTVLDNIRKLVAFFFVNGSPQASAAPTRESIALMLVSGPFGSFNRGSSRNTDAAQALGLSAARLRELRLLTREFGPSMRDFGVLISAKVAERVVSRALRQIGKLVFRE